MKKTILLIIALAASFVFGVAFSKINIANSNTSLKRVTGIGGIFFKSKDPKKMREWYKVHLGVNTNQYGAVFEWRQASDSTQKGFTQWSLFKESTKYFEPSTKEFMMNYRVADLEKLVAVLKLEGVTILDTIESYDYGKFVHIMDEEQNKIELWEPNDKVYEQMGAQMELETTK